MFSEVGKRSWNINIIIGDIIPNMRTKGLTVLKFIFWRNLAYFRTYWGDSKSIMARSFETTDTQMSHAIESWMGFHWQIEYWL